MFRWFGMAPLTDIYDVRAAEYHQRVLTFNTTPHPGAKVWVGGGTRLDAWKVHQGVTYVPRVYARSFCKSGVIYPLAEKIETDWGMKSSPIHGQSEAIQKVLDHFKQIPEGILQAKPGTGKTVMALSIMASMQLRTLVIVDRELLVAQWRHRIAEHTTLMAHEVGTIQGKNVNLNRPIVIGLVKTLALGNFPMQALTHFGLIIFDECHIVGPPESHAIFSSFAAPFRLGLSATPKRGDDFNRLLNYHLGDVICVAKSQNNRTRVFSIGTGVSLERREYHFGRKINIPKMKLVLAKHRGRNKLIAHVLHRLIPYRNKILVLSSFREQLSDLADVCNFVPSYITRNHPKTGELLKQKDLEDAGKRQVIFATYKMIEKGYDNPDIDTLVFATPIANPEQSIGRAQRVLPGKQATLIIDFVDDFSGAKYIERGRYTRLNQMGTEIHQIKMENLREMIKKVSRLPEKWRPKSPTIESPKTVAPEPPPRKVKSISAGTGTINESIKMQSKKRGSEASAEIVADGIIKVKIHEPCSRVRYGLCLRLQLGNYESVEHIVHIETPCNVGTETETYEKLHAIVAAIIQEKEGKIKRLREKVREQQSGKKETK